jgi:6-pyruvoyl-tetrahydropterin synthase
MHDPRVPHLAHVKKILRYLKGTIDHGLLLNSSSPTSLTVYSGADWAGDALKCKGLLKSSMGSITQIYSLTQGEQTRISVRL